MGLSKFGITKAKNVHFLARIGVRLKSYCLIGMLITQD